MEGAQIGLLVTRSFLLLCALVVLGISAHLTGQLQPFKDYYGDNLGLHGLGPDLDYGVFVGVWGAIQALLGLAAIFVAAIPWLVLLVFDVLAAIFYLAFGIVLAVWLGKWDKGRYRNDSDATDLKADTAFAFLGLIATLAALALVLVWHRKR